ncbi:hypothetical protein SAMN05444000_11580 [Shimia gijangensis]|uniref:Uncharacterized protein n=1 Tax=Shimia gijangensis TaxID=1470563 RepID=A0A1M6N8U7_9RHOB|nr:hypothetical protein SAMN05444000_11580 [Shimia gijangensis]
MRPVALMRRAIYAFTNLNDYELETRNLLARDLTAEEYLWIIRLS